VLRRRRWWRRRGWLEEEGLAINLCAITPFDGLCASLRHSCVD
jgi:hypothetical protein